MIELQVIWIQYSKSIDKSDIEHPNEFSCFDTLDINASCFLHIPQFVCLYMYTSKHKNRKSSCLF